MARRRLGAVVELPEAHRLEVEGIRAVCGYRGVSRIDPHVTVIAPFNLSYADWPSLRRCFLEVVGESAPFRVRIGELMTFEPSLSVVALCVEDLDGGLKIARDRLLASCGLSDHPERDFRPHVTLADGLTSVETAELLRLLRGVEWEIEIGAISILELPSRVGNARWRSVVSPLLGETRRVVRGPLLLSLVTFVSLEREETCSEESHFVGGSNRISDHLRDGATPLRDSENESAVGPEMTSVDHGIVVAAYVGSDEVGRVVASRLAPGIISLRYFRVSEVEYRGSGVGRAIFDHLLEYLRRNDGRFLLAPAESPLDGFLTVLGFEERNDPVLAQLVNPYGTILKVRSFSIR
ncbi:MAG: 2'-5' RNA ligase family protein [Acidimicrobiales bacterium]